MQKNGMLSSKAITGIKGSQGTSLGSIPGELSVLYLSIMPELEQIQKSFKSKCVVETEITCLRGPELTSNCLVLLRPKPLLQRVLLWGF